MNRIKVVVVTRHVGVIRWLRTTHPEFEIVDVLRHVHDPNQIRDCIVIGALPVHMLQVVKLFGYIRLTGVPLARKGFDLTCEEMCLYDAHIEWYETKRVGGPEPCNALARRALSRA